MDFFNPECQEPPLNNALFGLCDDQDGTKAYTNVNEPTRWVATVKNDSNISLQFTPVDACIIKSWEEPDRGRCDGMLTSENHLFFVELKEVAASWISDAIDQLESTVQFFIEHHDISPFKHKKAYACNKKHSHFQEVDNEVNLQFFRNYKFRLDVQDEIIIV